MLVENFWVYQAAFWLSGVIFTIPMEKKEKPLKICGILAAVILVCGHLILWCPEGQHALVEFIWKTICCMVMASILYYGWDISWTVAIYNMIWGVSIWQIVVEGTTVLALFYRMFSDNLWVEKVGVMVFYAVTYLLCLATIARWMPRGRKDRLGPRQMSLSLLIFTIINLLSFHEEVVAGALPHFEWGYYYLLEMICIVVLYLEAELFKKSQLQQEMEMINLLYVTQQEQYRVSKENIALINQKCHDLKHQIRVLRSADKEELDRYLGEIEDSVKIYEAIVKTGNDVFDTILTEKSLYCKEHQIQVSCVADTSQLGMIDTIDLYALLGNAMDNAIEAVEKFEEPQMRQIDVIIYCQQNFLVMNFINPVAEKLVYEDGLPVTTKRDVQVHGFGLRSMKRILKKYDGFLNVSEEDGCFSLKMLVPVAEK